MRIILKFVTLQNWRNQRPTIESKILQIEYKADIKLLIKTLDVVCLFVGLSDFQNEKWYLHETLSMVLFMPNGQTCILM